MPASPWIVEARGQAELKQALALLDKRLPGRVIPRASKRAAERVVLPVARTQAPRVEGDLEATLRVLATQTRARLVAGGIRGVVHAPVVHFGWPGHNIEPNPYLYRALELTGPGQVAQVHAEELAVELRRLELK